MQWMCDEVELAQDDFPNGMAARWVPLRHPPCSYQVRVFAVRIQEVRPNLIVFFYGLMPLLGLPSLARVGCCEVDCVVC